MSFPVDVAPLAETDIDDILEWSVAHFGPAVRDGYEELITAGIARIAADPEHPGTHARPELGSGIRVSHLRLSRDGVPPEVRRIIRPRHFLIYRRVGETVQIVRVLHDAMDLAAHLT